jgi:TM2 domain-containing membrane protein YozV
MSDPIKYFVMVNNEQRGPFTLEQLQGMWKSGAVTMDTQYWVEGLDEWMPLSSILDLIQPPQRMQQQPAYFPASGQLVRPAKSRGIFIILGLFLGCLGIHNFYAGYYGRGAAQLIITILLGWLLIGLLVTAIWALIEICTVKIDGNGDRMS